MNEACGKVCPAEHLSEWAHRSCRKPEGHEGAHICDDPIHHKFKGLVIVR
jgi:hypothetical protein